MLGASNNNKSPIGQVVTGRTKARVPGGYIIESIKLPQGRGFVPEENKLAIGSEILVKVLGGYHQGLPILHPIFNGFR